MKFLRFFPLLLCSPLLFAQESDIVFERFEGDGFGTWKEEGEAFGKAPTAGGQGELAGRVHGYADESFASSFAEGADGTGTLLSPEFTIELPYISFLVGGGGPAKGQLGFQLLIDDAVVRREAGQNDRLLRPRTWDVTEFQGKTARLRLLDEAKGEWGFLMLDHVVFTDYPNTKFPNATRDGKPFEPGLVSTEAIPGVTIPPGSQLEVFATYEDHKVYSPTALCIDENGRVLVTETHRFRYGIPDNRNHRYWHTDDIASTTVEDRRKMHEKWDEKYPIADMTKKSEKIRLLVDEDRDGKADQSKVFADGFDDLLDGTGAGVFSYNGTVYFACIPHIWSLRDTTGDGVADTRKKLLSGFGVRVSLSGHDLNGFALGPDGRLYGSIGDRAMNVTTASGAVFAYTDQGAVFRFDPDGSNFEVVHAGLRNPKEVAFDQFGNCISVDNNSDQGDKARVVYIVDGADSGWRTDHQNLHTFHREVGYEQRPINQWMQERQWDKHHDGQPAFLLPPIDTLTSGPSGLTYFPGSGFSNNCVDSFLICDYRGGPAASGIWAFGIEPDGAGMKMTNPRKFNWGAAVTDVEFGYDGRLYVTDFIDGWQSHENGRVYTLSSPDSLSDGLTAEVTNLMAEGFSERPAVELFRLMAHPDQRIRLRAQIELSQRPEAVPFFINATEQVEERLLRLHGVWGLWIRARKDRSQAATEQLLKLLGDADDEVRAQAARALGEAPLQDTGRLLNSMQDPSGRVKAFAAISATRLRAAQAFNPALIMLAENADRDPYLRHAAVMALLGSGTEQKIAALQTHPNKSVRLGAVLALRRLYSPELVRFFFDKDPAIADEAIRAVHDLPVEAARPAVAALLDEYAPDEQGRPLSRMMLRRLLHSAFRAGGAVNAARLMRVAANPTLDRNERLEALRLLKEWTDPHPVDQSLGRYAPLDERPLDEIKSTLETELVPLLGLKDDVLAAAIDLVTHYDLSIESLDADGLALLLEAEGLNATARSRALELLAKRNPENLSETLRTYASAEDTQLAARALELLAEKAPASALESVRAALGSEDLDLAQRAWVLLGALPGDEAAALVEEGLRNLMEGTLNPALALEVLEAAGQRGEESVKNALASYEASLPQEDPLAPYRVALVGGDEERGSELFKSHPVAQCLRCHRVDEGHSEGGEAGPNLLGIGSRHDAEYLLESLIAPNAEVTPGFGIVSVTLSDGANKAGLLLAEDEDTIDLLEGEDLWRIRKSDIKERTQPISAMAPPMGAVLSKRELRDLVAWLSSLKDGSAPAPPAREAKLLEPATPTVSDSSQTEDVEPAAEEASSSEAEATPTTPPDPAPEDSDENASPTETTPPTEDPTEPPQEVASADEIDPAVMAAGKESFILCMGCHGPEGQGMPGAGPPLAESEWVNGPAENLIRIQLRGLQDEITVAGRTYYPDNKDFPATGMEPQAFQTDEQIAAVLTYVRNSFGNKASAVTPDMVAALRDEVGKPKLKVADLIPPAPAANPTPDPTPPPPALAVQSRGIGWKTIFVVLGILIWLGICMIPYLKGRESS